METIGTKQILQRLGLSQSSRDRLVDLRKRWGMPQPIISTGNTENQYDKAQWEKWFADWEQKTTQGVLDEKEICAIVGRTSRAVKAWVKEGRFPKPKIRPYKRNLWAIEDLKVWAQEKDESIKRLQARKRMREYFADGGDKRRVAEKS